LIYSHYCHSARSLNACAHTAKNLLKSKSSRWRDRASRATKEESIK
jgi:hypothetical protein